MKKILSLLLTITMFSGILVYAEDTETPEITIMHNIAEKYAQDTLLDDGNMMWFLADLEAYKTLYPTTQSVLNETQIQKCLDKLIEYGSILTTPGDLSKIIIALRSLGYDARKLVTKDRQSLDIVEKLTALVDARETSVTNIYTLPYVIIALQQGEGYATAEQMDYLIGEAILNKAAWQDTQWGTDGATPMILALSPYYDTNEDVKTAIDEAVEIVKACQSDDGLMGYEWDGFFIGSASSTGLAMAAFASIGIDCETVIKNDKTLIDGMMTQINQTGDGFLPDENSFSTEQAFRGLIAWQLSKQGKRLYDFKEYPMNEAKATVDLPEPEPEPESPPHESTDTVSIKIKVMTHNEDDCDNSYTYRSNSAKYTAIVNETVIVDRGVSVLDALDEALTRNDIDYVERDSGYIVSIDGVDEYDHGDKSGWMFTVDGEHVNTGSNSTFLAEDSTVIWFYTDNYTMEKGSENFSTSLGSGSTIKKEEEEKETEEDVKEETKKEFSKDTFLDVEETDWFYDAVKFVWENDIMNGTENGFEPQEKMTRAMLVTVLFRLGNSEEKERENSFSDIKDSDWFYESVLWAKETGVVEGISATEFAPNDAITREQMALILYRYATMKGYNVANNANLENYKDKEKISVWALDAVLWANENSLLNGSDNKIMPGESATRAEIATILMRFCSMN